MGVLTEDNLVEITRYQHASSPAETPLEKILNPYLWGPLSRLVPDVIYIYIYISFLTLVSS